MIEQPFFLMGVLALNVAVSEWLARHTPLRHLGSALLVIVLTAVVANVGVIPTYSDEQPVYTGVFTYLAPLAIFWLLLQVNLGGLLRVRPSTRRWLLPSCPATRLWLERRSCLHRTSNETNLALSRRP